MNSLQSSTQLHGSEVTLDHIRFSLNVFFLKISSYYLFLSWVTRRNRFFRLIEYMRGWVDLPKEGREMPWVKLLTIFNCFAWRRFTRGSRKKIRVSPRSTLFASISSNGIHREINLIQEKIIKCLFFWWWWWLQLLISDSWLITKKCNEKNRSM